MFCHQRGRGWCERLADLAVPLSEHSAKVEGGPLIGHTRDRDFYPYNLGGIAELLRPSGGWRNSFFILLNNFKEIYYD